MSNIKRSILSILISTPYRTSRIVINDDENRLKPFELFEVQVCGEGEEYRQGEIT